MPKLFAGRVSRVLVIGLAALSVTFIPGLAQPAYAADCHGDQNSHPDCFNVFVDKADNKDLYWASGSYNGSLSAFTMEITLEGENGNLIKYETKNCFGSCYIGTDSVSSGSNDSFCATLSATVGNVSVFSDTKCRVL